MRNLLSLSLLTVLTLFSCSKGSNNTTPTVTSPTVTTVTIPTLAQTTFAGGGNQASTDGTGASAQFYSINKLTADKAGNVYVLEVVNVSTNLFYKIRKVTAGGVTSTLFIGGAETFVNNVPVQKSKIYNIYDIASDPNGSLYVLAYLTDYSTVQNANQTYYQEMGTYKLNTSTGNLDVVSVSSSTASTGIASWAASYNLLNNIAVDGSGNIYGAYSPGNTTGIPSGGKIYKISTGSGALLASVDNAYPSSLYAEGNGSVYVSTSTSIVKITGTQQTSTFYTYPYPATANPSALLGNQSGTLYCNGGLYDSSKAPKGTGFYQLKTDGTIGSEGIVSSAQNTFGAVADVSGNIYYVLHTAAANNSGGGYTIQKVTLN